jgi:hypothetical protein
MQALAATPAASMTILFAMCPFFMTGSSISSAVVGMLPALSGNAPWNVECCASVDERVRRQHRLMPSFVLRLFHPADGALLKVVCFVECRRWAVTRKAKAFPTPRDCQAGID